MDRQDGKIIDEADQPEPENQQDDNRDSGEENAEHQVKETESDVHKDKNTETEQVRTEETEADEDEDTRRIRTLTTKALEQFEHNVIVHTKALVRISQTIDLNISNFLTEDEEGTLTKLKLENWKEDILRDFGIFEKHSSKFVQFLQRTRSYESEIELSLHSLAAEEVYNKTKAVLQDIDNRLLKFQQSQPSPKMNVKTEKTKEKKEVKTEIQSNISKQNSKIKSHSHRTPSSRSSAQSSLIRQRMKSEAAKCRLEFAEMEAKLKLEKAQIEEEESMAALKHARKKKDLEINMSLLKVQQEAMEAKVEYDAMCEELSETNSQTSSVKSSVKYERTKQYVIQQSKMQTEVQSRPVVEKEEILNAKIETDNNYQNKNNENSEALVLENAKENIVTVQIQPSISNEVVSHEVSNPAPESNVQPPITSTSQNTIVEVGSIGNDQTNNTSANIRTATERSRLFMKKDILMSRLTSFNDRPENYLIWKAKFTNIMRDLQVTPSEELDLLVRWLGPESSKQAQRLQASNSHDTTAGLKRVWDRLDERYGSPELIEATLKERLNKFTKINNTETRRLYELSDILAEIECVKENPKYKALLAYFDSSTGVNPIVSKLPNFLQTKWTDRASTYKNEKGVVYPPFIEFVKFVQQMSTRLNDPSFNYDTSNSGRPSYPVNKPRVQNQVLANKTQVAPQPSKEPRSGHALSLKCPIHEQSNHSLNECRQFQKRSIEDRKAIIMKHGICFKCCEGKHLAKTCQANVKCKVCNIKGHPDALHIDKPKSPSVSHGGEQQKPITKDSVDVVASCTEICGDNFGTTVFNGKSCAKTILLKIYPDGKPEQCLKTYAIIDDQSNRSLARSDFFEYFQEKSDALEYTLASCSGKSTQYGRRANGYVVESLDGTAQLNCPTLIECNEIPNSTHEIATPTVARQYPHLQDIERYIPEYEPDSKILLLIGRDLLAAHHIIDQRLGKDNEPYAQKLRLGWAIIGETCLGLVHATDTVFVNKTSVLTNGRQSYLKPCEYGFKVKDTKTELEVGKDIFVQTLEDDTTGLSQEDREFLSIMDNEFMKTKEGNLSAPLPFLKQRPKLENNYHQAKQRAENLTRNLKHDIVKQEHFFEFMGKIFKNNHAEEAPPVEQGEEVWYLPIFGVYHQKKPSKIRVVFDSAAKYNGLCLNDVLMKGPDLTNNLVGVLLKFRKGHVATIADVEQMFFNFQVHESHRNYLRFIWFRDNDITKPLTEYRMRVHVFGNSLSPAVANYGLRKAVCSHDGDTCDDVCTYVKDNFYVDDALVSGESVTDVVSLIKRTQERLSQGGNIRLHKIVSNNEEVLSKFPQEDLAKDATEIDFNSETSCLQRSLGLSWDVIRDIFTYQLTTDEKPNTKRGMLSVINGIFDPLGFIAPVILEGRLIMREVIQSKSIDWDEKLPIEVLGNWSKWKEDLETLEIKRMITTISLDDLSDSELHVFSDASKDAISAVAYLRILDSCRESHIGFVFGKSKLAPTHGHTIPRLELCAAGLATEVAIFIQKQLKISPKSTHYYTDSQVVLGNRVDKILRISSKTQWSYVPTTSNPADRGTRPTAASDIKQSDWLCGPKSFLNSLNEQSCTSFGIVEPDDDKEVRPLVNVMKTSVVPTCLDSSIFLDIIKHFSSWMKLMKTIKGFKKGTICYRKQKFGLVDNRNDIELMKESKILILKEVQREVYSAEIESLKNNKQLKRNSSILSLSPKLDEDGILRVGGRLNRANINVNEKNPIIIPGKHHVATLLIRHFHESISHQGRHITEGAVRTAGYWITGGKRLISSIIHSCVICRKIRGTTEQQKMSDLPIDRLTPSPPFTFVGVDTFGPWLITTRRTRGGAANSKRWAIMFSCLVSRGIHIEVIEELSSSSFINALRRFIALRGPVKELRSDRGTNFIGAAGEMNINVINVEDKSLKQFLLNNETTWKFNTPHSSHMSGSWERMIGITRRILDSMLLNQNRLTHEVLCTLMAEVCAIVNARPIVAVSTDPEEPSVLSPSTLITQKSNTDTELYEKIDVRDMYKSQWKYVQILANDFWKKWQQQYLQNLQKRSKWNTEQSCLKKGDVVLMKDKDLCRNQWSVGTIEDTFPSEDNRIRKVLVRTIRDNRPVTYTRPITELVYLLSE